MCVLKSKCRSVVMNMEGSLITSLIFDAVSIITIFTQSKKIDVRSYVLKITLTNQNNEELIATVREKLKSSGDIKTIRYLREAKGRSMIEAKQFVDALKE